MSVRQRRRPSWVSATADTYDVATTGMMSPSTWTEVIASTSGETYIYAVESTGVNTVLDIGIGAAASEVLVTSVPACTYMYGIRPAVGLPYPILVPTATRVALRTTNTAVASVYFGTLTNLTYRKPYIEASSARGTATAYKAVGGTDTWVTLVASTSEAIYLTHVGETNSSGSSSDYEIGIGAASSEVTVGTFRAQNIYQNGINGANIVTLPFPLRIAGSTRIAARVRSPGSSLNISIGYVYESKVVP